MNGSNDANERRDDVYDDYDDYTQWEQPEGDHVLLIALLKAKLVKRYFAMSSFLHGTDFNFDKRINTCPGFISSGDLRTKLDGLLTDARANYACVINIMQ